MVQVGWLKESFTTNLQVTGKDSFSWSQALFCLRSHRSPYPFLLSSISATLSSHLLYTVRLMGDPWKRVNVLPSSCFYSASVPCCLVLLSSSILKSCWLTATSTSKGKSAWKIQNYYKTITNISYMVARKPSWKQFLITLWFQVLRSTDNVWGKEEINA